MLKNVKISIKMLIMVAVPIVGMLIFAARDISSKSADLRSLQTTCILTAFAVKSGSLIHELQKERGLSAGFISTGGAKFREDLARQRGSTDNQIKELKLHSSGNTGNLKEVKERLVAADAMLGRLALIRSGVDSLTLSQKESMAYYIQTISSYLDVVAQISVMSMNPEITREAVAYNAFLNVKEQTGLERATLNGVFATNRFDDKTYESYIGIAVAQATYLDVFAKFADPYQLKTFQKKLNAPYYGQVQEMRSTALAMRRGGNSGIRPETWFATSTVMVNVMKEMEDLLASHMGEKANGLADAARLSLMLSVFTAAIAAAVSLQFGFIIMIGIRAPLRTMASVLKDMADGRRNMTRRFNADRSDEIGEVNHWFNRFMDNIPSAISEENEAVTPKD